MPSGWHIVGAQDVVIAGSQWRWEELSNPSGPLLVALVPASLPNVCTPLPRGHEGGFSNHLHDGITNVIFRAHFGEERPSCA